jgi:hypothetical protein
MKEHGDKFREHLIEQYKTYVEMADRVSSRRTQIGQFYISLLSGLLVLLSLVVGSGSFGNMLNIIFVTVAVLGIVLCIIWSINIRSYKQLNKGKFKVIHEIEEQLPFPCYTREWEILEEGKKGGKYLQLTRVEQYVPFALSVPFLLLLAYSLYTGIK